jgi:hypothetical protein
MLAFVPLPHILSRPRLSDDNPCSRAQFKTAKYRADLPDHFGSSEDARGVGSSSGATPTITTTAGLA